MSEKRENREEAKKRIATLKSGKNICVYPDEGWRFEDEEEDTRYYLATNLDGEKIPTYKELEKSE